MQKMMRVTLKDGRTAIMPDNEANKKYYERNYKGCTFQNVNQPEKKDTVTEVAASNETAPNGAHSQTVTARRGRPTQKQTDEI